MHYHHLAIVSNFKIKLFEICVWEAFTCFAFLLKFPLFQYLAKDLSEHTLIYNPSDPRVKLSQLATNEYSQFMNLFI